MDYRSVRELLVLKVARVWLAPRNFSAEQGQSTTSELWIQGLDHTDANGNKTGTRVDEISD